MLKFEVVKIAQKCLGLNKVCKPAGGEETMLRWAAAFFVIAIVAAALGFARMGSSAMFFARIMFIVFLLLAIIAFMLGKLRAR
jgi:uncharacterized membrane protein YtjA (UPF0391 family)